MNKILGILLLSLPATIYAEELHYNDCVEIISGFYYQPDQHTVDYISDQRKVADETEYKVGNLFFGVWISQKDLKKVDKKMCEEAHKKQESK